MVALTTKSLSSIVDLYLLNNRCKYSPPNQEELNQNYIWVERSLTTMKVAIFCPEIIILSTKMGVRATKSYMVYCEGILASRQKWPAPLPWMVLSAILTKYN